MRHLYRRVLFWLSWPGLALYFARSTRSRVALQDETGKILLVQGRWKLWYDEDSWGLPGGGVQNGERPAEGAVRELTEELGIDIDETSLLAKGTETSKEYGLRYRVHFFTATVSSDTTLKLQTTEIVDAQWFSVHDTASYRLKPEARRALELLALQG